jgi:uncharacterized protein (DUF58 family)
MALAGLIASAGLGMDTTRNAAHEAFTLLFALIAAALVTNRRFRPSLSIKRDLPRFATAGRPFTYRLLVRNRGARPLRHISIGEWFADPRPSFQELDRSIKTRAVGGEKRSGGAWHASWRRLCRLNRRAETEVRELPLLAAGAEVEISMPLLPLRRGYLKFEAITAGRSDIFGLFSTVRKIAAAQAVLVLPRRYPLPPPRLAGGRKYHQGGMAMASKVGDADEFVALRDYRQGDPLRNIHWKSWARTGKPVVKEHADEFFTRHALVLDTFAREEDRVFEEAVSVAASFLASVETHESLLDLMFIGTQACCFTTGRSIGQAEKALEILACARAQPDKPFSDLARHVLGRVQLLSSCICVLLAWDEARQVLVRRLRGRGIPVKVILIREPGEKAPEDPVPMQGGSSFNVLEAGRIEEGMRRL